MQRPVVPSFLVITALVVFLPANAVRHPLYTMRYENHPNWRLLPHDKCGVTRYQNSLRILQGNEAKLGQFPWLVGLIYSFGPFHQSRIECSGSLINDRYVVTATHCMVPKRAESVVIGEHRQSTYIDCDGYRCNPPALIMRIEEYICHPAYKSLEHDICLLRLSQKIVYYNDAVRPICLPTFPYLHENSFDELVLEIAGWGQTSAAPWQNVLSDYLMRAWTTVIPQRVCRRWPPVLDSQICTRGDDGKGSCHGDSGGPLMAMVYSPTKRIVTVIVGITSHGKNMQGFDPTRPTCGNHITIFTRVSVYIDWILDSIRE